jgi:hypothetical protein
VITLDRRTVVLSPREKEASDTFDRFLDKGLGIPDALRLTEVRHPGLDPAFYAWLL